MSKLMLLGLVSALVVLAHLETVVVPFGLYRSSAIDRLDGQHSRFHLATFDSKESDSYNFENCQKTAKLFQEQPGVTEEFWCKKEF